FYSTLFNDLFKKITNLNNINLFFFGFSRGAIMGFYIIERLIKEEGLNNIKAFVTVDPVINPFKMKELNDLNIKWYRRDNGEWEHSAKRPPLSGTYLPSYNYFPVINKLENINCFNVFQRRSIIYSDKFIKMPVGSAVSNAISLNNMDDDLNEIIKTEKNSFERQLSQYDEIIKNHTPDMIEKQWKRMFKIAEKLAV
ncbi:MAG: hypothetical protein JXB50_13055, partial [Spirochaetes bacterium]|nr:hypothetical protein [Spirochaetota bacterium]